MRRILLSVILVISVAFSVCSQQMADTMYAPPPFVPRFTNDKGPKVMIDESHHNFHTSQGRYFPFCKVLALDGYKILRGESVFNTNSLKDVDILVIANSLAAEDISEWKVPNPSAFSTEEIKSVNDWVNDGGSLFLIADHMPFAGAAADLAASFGFKFYNGFALDTVRKGGSDLFVRSNHSLEDNIITSEPGSEPIDSIVTFTGQAFDIPENAKSILTLNENFKLYMCEVAWEFNKSTIHIDGKGKSQGAFMKYGKGKIVVFGEAAMFSAQTTGNGGKAGMNSEKAKYNYRLLRSILHWLDD